MFDFERIYALHYDEVLCNEEVHLLALFALVDDKPTAFDMVTDFVIGSYESRTGVFGPDPATG